MISYAVTDLAWTNKKITNNKIDLVIKNTQPGTIEIGPLDGIASGGQGYMTNKIEEFRLEPIVIAPSARAYTVSIQAKVDGVVWEKLVEDIVRTTGDKELNIMKVLQDVSHRYPVKIILTTTNESDEVYTVYIPIRVVGGSNI